MSHHIQKALELAEKYEKIGDKENANKFFAIAEKYERLFEKQRRKENEKNQP